MDPWLARAAGLRGAAAVPSVVSAEGGASWRCGCGAGVGRRRSRRGASRRGEGVQSKGSSARRNAPRRRKPVARRPRTSVRGTRALCSPPTPPQPLSDRRTTLRTTLRGRRPRHSSNRSSPWQLARSATQRPRRATTRIFSNTYCFNTPTSPPSLNTTIA